MKTIDENVKNTFWSIAMNTEDYTQKIIKLSCRDKIVTSGISVCYYLWGTCIVCFDKINREFLFYPASEGSKEYTTVSSTTKSRLNALFSYAHNVQFTQKNWILYLGDKMIKTDTKYRMLDDMNFEEIK